MDITHSKQDTLFVTFYSFKGGVGRTLALVNSACILAGLGRCVLMIDFDLEAPGLTMLAFKQMSLERNNFCPSGLIDLIFDFLSDPIKSPIADKDNPARYQEYVCSLDIPSQLNKLQGGKLDLMPCGCLDNNYEERFYHIDFANLYQEKIGQPLFKLLKNNIKLSNLYDYVLIDSRTGFSDEGGISTRDLAEHIVVLSALNRQNIDGTVRFLDRLKKSGWQEGKFIFVLSPVPFGYEELRAERKAHAKKEIEEKTGYKADLSLHIPYHPRIALDEEPFIFNWTDTDLFKAYESICFAIQDIADDTVFDWATMALQFLNNANIEEGKKYLSKVSVIDDKLFNQLLNSINYSINRRVPEYWNNANEIIDLLITCKPNNSYLLNKLAPILIDKGNYDLAIIILNNAIINASSNDSDIVILSHIYLGNIYQYRGNYNKAMEEYNIAISKANIIDDDKLLNYARHSIAHVYEDQKQYDLAINHHEKLLQSGEDNGELHCIGNILSKKGDLLEALKKYEELFENVDDIEDNNYYSYRTQHGFIKIKAGLFSDGAKMVESGIEYFKVTSEVDTAVSFIVMYAKTLVSINELNKSLELLDENWQYIIRNGNAIDITEAYLIHGKILLRNDKDDKISIAISDLNEAVQFYHDQEIYTEDSYEAEILLEEANKKMPIVPG